MVFRISSCAASPEELTQRVLQVTEMLSMYQAELARILKLHCSDIGQMSCGQAFLEPDSIAWKQAVLFIQFFQNLYDEFEGNGVGMRHWLRSQNNGLNGVPLLLIVDDGELLKVMQYLSSGESSYEQKN